jgi:hypothetical protein
MYAVLVKNDNDSYDVIALLNHEDPQVIVGIDEALASGKPVVGMDASEHKLTATYGSSWNGTSFSGGKPSRASEATQEQLDSFNLYAFLCDNVLVARYGVGLTSPKVQMFEAALASEVTLVKVPEDQAVTVGETHNWDGSRFI